jgi:hypothetical protein
MRCITAAPLRLFTEHPQPPWLLQAWDVMPIFGPDPVAMPDIQSEGGFLQFQVKAKAMREYTLPE